MSVDGDSHRFQHSILARVVPLVCDRLDALVIDNEECELEYLETIGEELRDIAAKLNTAAAQCDAERRDAWKLLHGS